MKQNQMETQISVPTNAWYGDHPAILDFPETWQIDIRRPCSGPSISDEAIAAAFSSPIGTPPLSELVKSDQTAVIIVDDTTRPTPAHRVLPYIINELNAGGIKNNQILIVMGVGCHRPMIRADLMKKLGEGVVQRFKVFNHFPMGDLVDLGTSEMGTPVHVNRFVAEADLKIGVGSIIPYPSGAAGFSGGAKIVVPAVSGTETIIHFHSIPGASTGIIESNAMRNNMEDIARMVGLDLIVNTTINMQRDIAGVFVGDMIKAHRAGIKSARVQYKVNFGEDTDITICNPYPFDMEFMQASRGLEWGYKTTKQGGTLILHASCSEGTGYHLLFSKGAKLWKSPEEQKPRIPGTRADDSSVTYIREQELIVCCPNVSETSVHQIYSPQTHHFRTWNETIEHLKKIHGNDASVGVLPCAPLCLD